MSESEPTVVGIAGSIRNRAGLDAVDGVDENVTGKSLVKKIENLEHRNIYDEDFLSEIQPLVQELTAGKRVLTNSDSLVLTALYGAMDEANIEFHKLTDYVGLDESYADTHVNSRDFEALTPVLERADGIILGTPVYFGDRSSLAHSFLNFAAERELLRNKVVGAVSVGSKRNGGQETANIYALFENLNHGAIIVGNGPKTCQYGGTGWGGDIGDVTEDDFGLETSLGTGLRVSSVAKLQRDSQSLPEEVLAKETPDPFTVGVIVTRDKNRYLQSTIERQFSDLDLPIEVNILNFSEKFIQACIGCDVCPTPGKVEDITDEGQDYKCIIDRDFDEERWDEDKLQDLHRELMRNDALLIGVLDTGEKGINDVYQALLERTRYIRRDDWRLHNIPLAAYVIKSPNRPSTYPLKIMTSWMRHNTIVHPPIVHTKFDAVPEAAIDQSTANALEQYYSGDTRERLEEFVASARRLRAASEIDGPDLLSYKATGYKNKMLDSTTSERT
jgi:multimeric flavodoxin WrbA